MGARVNLSCRRRDGTIFPAQIALSALDTGQGTLVSAAIRDVARQRQATLAQARDLRQSAGSRHGGPAAVAVHRRRPAGRIELQTQETR